VTVTLIKHVVQNIHRHRTKLFELFLICTSYGTLWAFLDCFHASSENASLRKVVPFVYVRELLSSQCIIDTDTHGDQRKSLKSNRL